jgi:hypothetical protein
MANTLKFGNGQWAVKDGSTLAYNSENGNFKPLPFDFTRSTSATRVNKDGLIETVGSNEPRIDFLNDSNGALKLEPSRTNLVTYSEDFSNAYWTNTEETTVNTSVAVSPDGESNADKLIPQATSNFHRLSRSFTVTTATTYTFSAFVKRAGYDYFLIRTSDTTNNNIGYDLLNGTVTYTASGYTSFIESYGNDWYRIGFVRSFTASSITINFRPNPTIISTNALDNITGDGTSGIYIWGAQLEAGSYATSYIPTSGSAVTKTVDTCSQTVPSGIIGQTEGVVYIDFLSVNNFEGSSGILFEIKEDNNNRINIYFSSGTPRLFGIEDSSGVFNQALSLTTGSVCKLAIKYNSTSTKVFINGSLSHTLNGINNIAFNDYSFSPNNNISYNEIKLYNTALTDAELQALTM